MKRLLFIGFLCLFSLYGMSGYYYYRGEKITIDINSDSMIVYRPSQIRSGNVTPSFQPTIIARNQVSLMALDNSTQIAAVGYIIGDTITRKMSNCFYVKLYEDADTTLLKEVIEETNTILLGQVPHMDKWYKIMISYSTINNSLDMSNYFYETGLFADVDPGFVFEFKPNCVSDYNYLNQWALPAINSCAAWGQTTGSREITVAVVDQGIEYNHREFAHTSFPSSTYDCYTGIYGLFPNEEPYGNHGTRVASLIVANHNYGYMAGLAPNVTIMPISHPLGSDNWFIGEDLAVGIVWAVQNGADVINCSWGDQGGDPMFEKLHSSMLEEAILYAITNGRYGKGCVVVFAAGNHDVIDYPAYFTPEIIVSGSVNDLYQRAKGSGSGESLDIMAPGEDVYVANLGNSYCTDSGTSFAAPYVSGIAALILSINPDLTREEVTNILEITTQKINGDRYAIVDERMNGKWNAEIGYGLVDAYAALLAAYPKFIQNQIYPAGTEIVEYAPEVTAGCSVTNSKPYGNVVLEAGSDVTLRAMDKIVLKPGFHAKKGSKLHIKPDTTLLEAIGPISSTSSAPQYVAPKSSTPTDDRIVPVKEIITNNSLQNVASEFIISTAIYTVSGQLLQFVEGGHHDVSHLPNGMYILQLRMSDGSMRSEKVANYDN